MLFRHKQSVLRAIDIKIGLSLQTLSWQLVIQSLNILVGLNKGVLAAVDSSWGGNVPILFHNTDTLN